MERMARIDFKTRVPITTTMGKVREIMSKQNPNFVEYNVSLRHLPIEEGRRIDQECVKWMIPQNAWAELLVEIYPTQRIININDVRTIKTTEIRQESPRNNHRKLPLWRFVLRCLADKSLAHEIKWIDNKGAFKFLQPHAFAQRWGRYTYHLGMNYAKLARSLRYYYHTTGAIAKIPQVRFGYKFDPRIVEGTHRNTFA